MEGSSHNLKKKRTKKEKKNLNKEKSLERSKHSRIFFGFFDNIAIRVFSFFPYFFVG